MAMAATSTVPVKTGTAPKAPRPATWSARSGICGSQLRPNRNSFNGTAWKKRQASKTSEATMPIVVRIATTEQLSMRAVIDHSKLLRARN